MYIRGKFVKLLAPEEDLGGEGGAGGGSEGDFDFEGAGDALSADLFGAVPTDTSPGNGEDGNEPSAATEQPAATPAPTAAPLQAPKTWRPEAAAKFATLPPEVQQEVLKREEDIFKGLEGYKADAGIGKAVKSVLDPYMPILQQAGIDPMQQISGLMHAHYTLATGSPEQKLALFQKLAQDYGVNLGGEAPYVDPQVQALQKQLSDLQSRMSGREQQEANNARAKLQAEIDTFASDPAHQYFDEVANDIAGLLRSGAAKDLQDAYDKAIWANPITRAKEQARLTADADAKAKTEAAERAKQARKAAGANVKSSAKVASGTAPLGSIDDTLKAALAEVKARA